MVPHRFVVPQRRRRVMLFRGFILQEVNTRVVYHCTAQLPDQGCRIHDRQRRCIVLLIRIR